jgi:hypothetical protein
MAALPGLRASGLDRGVRGDDHLSLRRVVSSGTGGAAGVGQVTGEVWLVYAGPRAPSLDESRVVEFERSDDGGRWIGATSWTAPDSGGAWHATGVRTVLSGVELSGALDVSTLYPGDVLRVTLDFPAVSERAQARADWLAGRITIDEFEQRVYAAMIKEEFA